MEAAQSDDRAGEAIPDNTTWAFLSCACYIISIGHERHAMIITWQWAKESGSMRSHCSHVFGSGCGRALVGHLVLAF